MNARRQSTKTRIRAPRGKPRPYQRTDGRWSVTLELERSQDGRRQRRPIYGRSAEEVLRRADNARRTVEATEFSSSSRLADWAAHWINTIKPTWDAQGRRTGMKHSSWRGYEKHVRLNIVPLLIGQMALAEIRAIHIRKWLEFLGSAKRAGGPLGPRSQKYALDTLRRALAAADADDLIIDNPALKVRPPSQTQAETQIFTLEQARRFLQLIKGHQDEALYLVSVFSGSRQGEALSLRRDQIAFERSIVRFTKTLDWVDGQPLAEEPKTHTSRRSVHLPPYVIEVLRRHIDEEQRRRDADPSVRDYALVFSGERGQPLRGSTVYRRFQRLLKANDLPVLRFHDLRHSSASIMLALGLSLHTVQKTIGHSSLQMLSQRYGHLVPELAAEEVAKLQDALLPFDAPSDESVMPAVQQHFTVSIPPIDS